MSFSREQNKVNSMKARESAINKRLRKGETIRTSKELAALVDKVYGTNNIEKYHTKKGA